VKFSKEQRLTARGGKVAAMKAKAKTRYVLLLVMAVAIVSYLFWGPLFPWNPVKIGYTEVSSPNATIYIANMTERDSMVYRIDEIIQEEEKFHDLKYAHDFKIIIPGKESSMKRFLPWLKGSRYSVSLSLADVVYIGPTARRSPNGIEPYLKHELSHLLIDQNTTFKKALKIHEQGWLAEGVAEYFSGRSFYGRDEFLERCKANSLEFTSLYEKNPLRMSLQEVRLRYTYYRFLIEFLVDTYGIEKLQQYLKRYVNDPQDYKKLFIEVYSENLSTILDRFNASLKD
jgi:hypothetical protein